MVQNSFFLLLYFFNISLFSVFLPSPPFESLFALYTMVLAPFSPSTCESSVGSFPVPFRPSLNLLLLAIRLLVYCSRPPRTEVPRWSDKKVFFISHCLWERSHNVQAPLSKRPRIRKRVENPSRLVNVRRKPLTLIAFLDILLRLFLHVQPPVSLGKSPVRQGSLSCMTSTNPFVQLIQK